MEQASEKGASAWLTTISIADYGFSLHKQAFWDALCVWYGWQPARLPSHCPCGEAFSVGHALSCSKGALPSIRHNRIRDLTAELLTEVCPNVAVEPVLQPLTGEGFSLGTTNVQDDARLDIKAQDFWDHSKRSTFLDVRVYNSHAPSNCRTTTAACYRRHEAGEAQDVQEESFGSRTRHFHPPCDVYNWGLRPLGNSCVQEAC